ncbi:MAG: hypothetical protein LDL33_11860 [Desulfomonile sp.]|nr:hypothetical protein [Desulfomonile sp.]
MSDMLGSARLVRELKSVGLDCGVRDGAIVTWHSPSGPTAAHKEFAALVIAAHEQPDGTEAVSKLKAYMKEQPDKWAAYVAERNRQQRTVPQDCYRAITDPLLFEALEGATLSVSGDNYEIRVPIAAWNNWLAAKKALRAQLPYAFADGQ